MRKSNEMNLTGAGNEKSPTVAPGSSRWMQPTIAFGFALAALLFFGAQAEASTGSLSTDASPMVHKQQLPQVLSHEIQAFGLGAAGTAGLLWLGNRKQQK